jgi:ElaA protein
MHFELKYFRDLSLDEFYAIMVLRQEVFVVEQNCPFLDCDGFDQPAWHLMAYDKDGKLGAYCRLLPVGTPYEEYASIGRVANSMAVRRSGVGRMLMTEAIKRSSELFGNVPIKIGAQVYLKSFYESFSFEGTGDVYALDGIDHIDMIRQI